MAAQGLEPTGKSQNHTRGLHPVKRVAGSNWLLFFPEHGLGCQQAFSANPFVRFPGSQNSSSLQSLPKSSRLQGSVGNLCWRDQEGSGALILCFQACNLQKGLLLRVTKKLPSKDDSTSTFSRQMAERWKFQQNDFY